MTKKNDDKIFDVRTLDFHLSHGSLKPAEYQKFLTALPDDEGNYDVVQIVDELDEEFDDEEDDTLTWSENSIEDLLPEDKK